MGYQGARVVDWVNHCQRETRVYARDLAVTGSQHQTERTQDNTPVDTSYLRDNIFAKGVMGPFQEIDGEVYYGGTETDVSYALYVEEGTGLWGPSASYYEIRPKDPDGFLRFHPYVRDSGGSVRLDRRTGNPIKAAEPVYAKVVLHPGSPGNHMFALGAAITEHEFPEFAQPVLVRWERACERWRRR